MKHEKHKPGKIFKYKDLLWIRIACSNDVIYKPKKFIKQNDAKLYHANQSLNARIFFPFSAYLYGTVPYRENDYKRKELYLDLYHSIKFNLILNAKCDHRIWHFLMKKPIHIQQEFEDANHSLHSSVQKEFNHLFDGFIRQFEKDNNMIIPTVISILIKNNIKIGAAIFYCLGFSNPLGCVSEDKEWDPITHQDWLAF